DRAHRQPLGRAARAPQQQGRHLRAGPGAAHRAARTHAIRPRALQGGAPGGGHPPPGADPRRPPHVQLQHHALQRAQGRSRARLSLDPAGVLRARRRISPAAAPPRHRAAQPQTPPARPRSQSLRLEPGPRPRRLAGRALLGARAQGGLSSRRSMTSAAAVSAPPPAPLLTPTPRRWARRVGRGLAWSLLAAVLLVLAAVTVYWRWSRRALPQVDGELRLPGLSAPVTVRRDALGVPHIEAASVPDLMRAQGYVTAQDRMWQMDLLRRRAEGQLAEAFGPAALVADRDIRTLGLGDAARRALPQVPPDLRDLPEAYTGGVNAWLEAHGDSLPLEFHLLRYAPRPWETADSLAVGKLLALDLAQGWEEEALRATTY